MAFGKRKTLQQYTEEWLNKADRLEDDILCLRAGWTPCIGYVSQEQTEQALDAIFSDRDHVYPLYPPGYTEEPVITEGKLQVDPEPKRRGWFW